MLSSETNKQGKQACYFTKNMVQNYNISERITTILVL